MKRILLFCCTLAFPALVSAQSGKWTRFENPVFPDGPEGSWEEQVITSSIVYTDSVYHLWYGGLSDNTFQIGHATSLNGIDWTRDSLNPVITNGGPGSIDQLRAYMPHVVYDGSNFHMEYVGASQSGFETSGYAISEDGRNWTKVNKPQGFAMDDSAEFTGDGFILYDHGKFHNWYTTSIGDDLLGIGYSTSPAGLTWTDHADSPVLSPDYITWESSRTQSGSVIKIDGTYHMWYCGGDFLYWQIGHATSDDGVNWTRDKENPVLECGMPGAWDSEFVAFPKVIRDEKTHELKMWYSGSGPDNFGLGYATIADTVSQTTVSIPDTTFLNALIDAGADTSQNQAIEFDEAAAVVSLDISERGIMDLTGIDAFENLDTLICSGNHLAELDLSGNTGLIYLDCSGNNLNQLNLSSNSNLVTILLEGMPELHLVCVWTDPFPDNGVQVGLEGSPNLYFSTICSKQQTAAEIAGQFQQFNLDHSGLKIKSRLYIPEPYDPGKTYPLVMTLHGAGEVGGDNFSHILYNHLATSWASFGFQAEHPCFVFSPQCPSGNWATTSVYEAVNYLLDSLMQNYAIDESRIYITGLSLGGQGTWLYLEERDLYAAAIPVCGFLGSVSAPEYVDTIGQIPVWNFHGNADNVVSVINSRGIINAFTDQGEFPVLTHHWCRNTINLSENEISGYIDNHADLIYSELPGIGHDAWNTAYRFPLARKWLFQQRKRSENSLSLGKTGSRINVSGEHGFSFQSDDPVKQVSVWLGHLNSCDWEHLADLNPSEGTFMFDSRETGDHPFARLRFLAHDSLGYVIDREYSDYICIDNEANGLPYVEITNDFSIQRDYTSVKSFEMEVRLGDPENLSLAVTILVSTDNGVSFDTISTLTTDEELYTEVINMEQLPGSQNMVFRVEASDGEHLVSYQTLDFRNVRGYENVSIPDTAFLNTLVGMGADTGGDGQINPFEASVVNSIVSSGSMEYGEIHDLTGIAAFENLDTLVLTDHPITSLDLHSNANLIYLRAACALENLDISGCQQLRTLVLSQGESELHNMLVTLDIRNNPALEEFDVSGMQSLTEVCVPSLPFPTEGMNVDTTGCPGICFQVDCNGDCEITGMSQPLAEKLRILPNPVSEILRIETPGFSEFTIRISTANGQTMLEKHHMGSTARLDFSSFEKGVYFITIRSKDIVATRKIVKL